MPARPPSIATKATILAAVESDVQSASEAARRAKVSRNTIYAWQREAQDNPALSDAVQQKRQALAEKMETLASKLADKLISVADEADLNNKASTALGISVDKWLALTGQPSSITEHRHLHLDLTSEAISALQAYLDAGFSEQEARADLAAADPDLFRALPPGPIIDLEAEDAGEDEDEATSEAPLEDAPPAAL